MKKLDNYFEHLFDTENETVYDIGDTVLGTGKITNIYKGAVYIEPVKNMPGPQISKNNIDELIKLCRCLNVKNVVFDSPYTTFSSLGITGNGLIDFKFIHIYTDKIIEIHNNNFLKIKNLHIHNLRDLIGDRRKESRIKLSGNVSSLKLINSSIDCDELDVHSWWLPKYSEWELNCKYLYLNMSLNTMSRNILQGSTIDVNISKHWDNEDWEYFNFNTNSMHTKRIISTIGDKELYYVFK